MITVFSIFVFFSATIPLVNLATVIYVYLKHIIDCLNILNVNRMEIDSQGSLIDVATNSAYFMIVSYQVCMMALFTIKGRDFGGPATCRVHLVPSKNEATWTVFYNIQNRMNK